MRANDLGTFVRNKGYHFDEEVDINLFGPRNDDENGRRMAKQYWEAAVFTLAITTANDSVWPRAKLGLANLAPSGPAPPFHALR